MNWLTRIFGGGSKRDLTIRTIQSSPVMNQPLPSLNGEKSEAQLVVKQKEVLMEEATLRTILTGNNDAEIAAAVKFLSPHTYEIFQEVDKSLVPHLRHLALEEAEPGSDDYTQRMLALTLLKTAGAQSELTSIREALLPQIEQEIREVIGNVRDFSNRQRAYYLISLLGRIGTPADAPFLLSLLPLWYWTPTTTSWGYTCNVSLVALNALREIGDESVASLLSQFISEGKLQIAEGLSNDGGSQSYKLNSEALEVVKDIRQKPPLLQ